MSDQDRITEFSVLYEIASMPTRLLDLEPIGAAVVDKATRLLGTDLAVMYLYSSNEQTLKAETARGVRLDRVEEIKLPAEDKQLEAALKAGQMFVWSMHHDAEILPPPLKVRYPIQEALYVPIGQGDHPIGLLYAARLAARPFTETEQSFFAILADKTATALDNRFLFYETQRQLGELRKQRGRLEISNQVGQQIISTLNLNDLLNQVARSIQSQFDYYYVSIWLPSQSGNVMKAYAAATRNGTTALLPSVELSLDPSKGIIGWVYDHGELYLADDVSTDPHYLKVDLIPDTCAEIALPLRIGSKTIGVLDVQSDRVYSFDAEDTATLQTLATQIAVAVRNAQLFEQAQHAREEAEEANKTKSSFLANMSHELRTPLNAILNFTEFVADGVFGEINDKQEGALRQSISSAEHLLTLINDVLDLTKIEAGMMELFIEQVDVNAELASVISIGKGLVKQKPIVLETQIDSLPPTFGDKRRLRQVFLNIISNAVKFTKAGTVSLSARFDDAANEIEVVIRDTGVGIAEQDRDKVFESFKQAKHDLTGAVGTGLGMPISKYFVEIHGGRIWFESAVGVGTTFFVRLPVLTHEEAEDYNLALKAAAQ